MSGRALRIAFLVVWFSTLVPVFCHGAALRRAPQFQAGSAYVSYTSSGLRVPSSPDNWLGGMGNWSTASDWSAGLPGSGSDVTINTGNDYVTLDTSASINSLTLGGTSGSSTLFGPSSAGYTVTIAGALTINQSGTLTLNGGTMTANGNSSNAGTINLSGSGITINANFTNSGGINFPSIAGMGVLGTFTNTGSINDVGIYNGGGSPISAGAMSNSGFVLLLILDVSGTLTNLPAGVLNVGHLTAADFINDGQMFGAVARGNSLNVSGTLTNNGNLDTSYMQATAGTLSNSGTINVGGVFTVAGNATNSNLIEIDDLDVDGQELAVGGTFNNNSRAMVQMEGPGVYFSVSNLINSGTIDLERSSQMAVAQNVTNSGTLETGTFLGGGDNLAIDGTLTANPSSTFLLKGMGDVANVGYITNAGNVYVGNGAMLNVTGGSHVAVNALPGFLNSGFVTVAQGGTLASPLTYTQTSGTTTVDGTLHISGRGNVSFSGGSLFGNGGTVQGSSIISNAAINIGDAAMTVGTLSFVGNYTQGANGSLTFDIAGASPGQYDQLNISGHAQLDGLMTVDLLHGFVPTVGNLFDIMNFASESGSFSMVVGLPINNQEHFELEYNSTNLTLDVVSGPTSGPTVSVSGNSPTMAFVSSSKSEPFIAQLADGNSLMAAESSAPGGTVPEPGSLVLFASGLVGVAAAVRRKIMV